MVESIGSRLKKARLEKGLTLEEVHKKTKIHLNILKNIEEEGLLNLSQVYIKGFLKIYAKFLGLEIKDSTASYKETKANLADKGPQPEKKSPSFLETTSVKLRSWRPSQKTKIAFIWGVVSLFSIAILFNLGKGFSRRRALMLSKAKKQKVQPQVTPKPIIVSSGINLGILARENCWISLKADGHLVFRSVLKKGKSESWQAKEKIEISLNNAGAVELVVNGERISSLAKGTKAPKNIIITKEGIKLQ